MENNVDNSQSDTAPNITESANSHVSSSDSNIEHLEYENTYAELNSDKIENLQQSWTSNAFLSNSAASTPFSNIAHPSRLYGASHSVGFLNNTSDSSLRVDLDKFQSSLLERGVSTSATLPSAQSKPHAGVSSIIHDAARITDWSRVLSLCQNHPEYASYAGRDGWTALHHACNRRCPRPEVVEALINAYPAALLQEEEKGWLPLHYACRFKAPSSVVNLLLNLYPVSGKATVCKQDRLKRTPLYYAVRYEAPSGVVGLLLQADPSAVLEEDQNDESPLALVWDSWAEKFEGKRLIHSFLPGGFPEEEGITVEHRAILLHQRLAREPKLRKRWNKVNMLLKAAFGFPVEESDEDGDDDILEVPNVNATESHRVWRIVHATAAVKCHPSLFLLACALHPEQAKEFDENDLRRPGDVSNEFSTDCHQTALHLAASSNAGGEAGKTVLITLLSLNQEAAEVTDGICGSLPLHRMVENTRKQDWPNHAGILYHFHPRAVQIQDHQDKLPLHRAAASIRHVVRTSDDEEKSDIVQLVRAYRQAAFQVDKSGCLPFHYIAANAQIWDDVVESVCSVNRNAVQSRAGPAYFNRLPIHLAAANMLSRESLIQKLILLHPRGASVPDSLGKLPIHLACEIGKEWETGGVRSIYEAFPNAIRECEASERGWLPLHMAAACSQSKFNLLKKLVELYPEATSVPDKQGCCALHLACSAGRGWLDGLKLLFEANASALSSFDNQKRLPFHVAALRYCTDSKLNKNKVDIRATPAIEAKKEKRVNFEEASQLDILYHLLRADPSIVLFME